NGSALSLRKTLTIGSPPRDPSMGGLAEWPVVVSSVLKGSFLEGLERDFRRSVEPSTASFRCRRSHRTAPSASRTRSAAGRSLHTPGRGAADPTQVPVGLRPRRGRRSRPVVVLVLHWVQIFAAPELLPSWSGRR